MIKARSQGRQHDQLRTVQVTCDVFTFGPASILFELGNTKVLCAINIMPGVPQFLRGKGGGWLTAEYALLPAATHVRTARESSLSHRNGRAVEISRLISRVMRSAVDLTALAEQTIYVDCDVLQADGGTRAACITAASLALLRAQQRWIEAGIIKQPLLKEGVAAVSVGIAQGAVLLDPDYAEDCMIDADFNVIITKSNQIIEIQGGAEKMPLSWEQFEQIRLMAIKGVHDLFALLPSYEKLTSKSQDTHREKIPFFSLQNRHKSF